jgi:hypothetical protein
LLGVLPELARAIHLELGRAIWHFSDGIFLCMALLN